jgi:hypothetical protein
MKISKEELIHHQLQSIIRDNNIPHDELKYLGERAGHHWYLIDGRHEVPSSDIMDVDEVDENNARI